jgi:hypothetical protein
MICVSSAHLGAGRSKVIIMVLFISAERKKRLRGKMEKFENIQEKIGKGGFWHVKSNHVEI